MKLIENLHHSDECSGTTVIDNNGKELRVHWTEGDSDAIICEGLGGPIVGVIRANGETRHADWEAIKPILEAPGENARAMNDAENLDHNATRAAHG
jgi:hypothetical protein